MPDVFISSDNIFSPLGVTTEANFLQLKNAVSGVKKHEDAKMSEQPFYAALFGKNDPFISTGGQNRYTKFEHLLIVSINDALQQGGIEAGDNKTILIISTTKGNISMLETAAINPALKERIALPVSARLVAEHFQFVHSPIVVSSACISGIMAIITGMRLIRSGQYENAVIAGADTISKFILSGFQAFQAVSPGPCKPFDKERDGINLGEGAGTVVLTSNRKYDRGIRVMGGSISNDANHLSAPSRTGAELSYAMTRSIQEAHLLAKDIDFISAHGTATVYNDEMEAKAITLSKLQSVPVNSLKGYYGHTLGAAGLIESIVSIQSLKEDLVIPTMGFEQSGVTTPINICRELQSAKLKNCLKTGSGFGGCNAALVLCKE